MTAVPAAIRTILLCLTAEEACAALVRSGAALARRHGAHLVGLHVLEAMPVYPGYGMDVPAPLIEPFTAARREQAQRIEAVFRKGSDGDTYTAEWRGVKTESTTAVDRMIESARAADLVVMSRPEQGPGYGEARGLQHEVIRASGRPVLVLPGGEAPEAIGRRVLVGWSATREAARAVHDALPLLEPGAELTLLRVAGGGSDELADAVSNELAAALARHGAKVTVTHRERDGASVAQLLLREAFEIDADLVVTGAFGHSRAYDFVIGAATSELLRTATLPALFSK